MNVIFVTSSDSHCEQVITELTDVYNSTQLQWVAIPTHSHQVDSRGVQWRGIDSLCVEAVDKCGCITEGDSTSVPLLRAATDHLHRVADSLPAYGALTSVYLWPPTAESSDYVLLLGALRRLKDWHNAKFTVFDSELSPGTEFLQRYLSADVCVSVDDFQLADRGMLWRGKLSVCDKLENRGLTIPGITLCKFDDKTQGLKFPLSAADQQQVASGALLGRMLEVMDEVSLASVPAYMRTPAVYKLSLYQKHPYTQVLLTYIQENTESGILARLAVYPPTVPRVPVCGDVGLSTDAWKENVMADIQFVQEPEEDLQDNYEFLHFIITSPDRECSMENFVACAHLLRSPYELNAGMVDTFHSWTAGAQDDTGVNIDLNGLPELGEEAFVNIQRDLVQLQHSALQNLLAEKRAAGASTVVPTAELSTYLADVRVAYLDRVAEQLPRFRDDGTLGETVPGRQNIGGVKPACEWPERLMQQYHESQKRSLSRIQSSESVPMSSPLQPCDTSATVDIQDFLKYFHPNGTAAADSLSPVRRRRPSRTQGRLIQPLPATSPIEWPDCKDVSSHDMYYNTGKKAERMNNHLNKMQEKYIKEETYSSCTGPQIVFPRAGRRTKARTEFELRRSPRKKSAVDLEPRRSPRKKTARAIYSDSGPATLEGRKPKRPRSPTATVVTNTSIPDPARQLSMPLTHRRSLNTSLSDSPSQGDSPAVPPGGSDVGPGLTSKPAPTQVDKLRRESTGSMCSGTKAESRSERHKRKLHEIVDRALKDHGVTRDDPIFPSCSTRLFKVTKLFVMDLPTSRNLKEEMKKIAEGQVKQVIEVDRNRQKSSGAPRPKKKSV